MYICSLCGGGGGGTLAFQSPEPRSHKGVYMSSCRVPSLHLDSRNLPLQTISWITITAHRTDSSLSFCNFVSVDVWSFECVFLFALKEDSILVSQIYLLFSIAFNFTYVSLPYSQPQFHLFDRKKSIIECILK